MKQNDPEHNRTTGLLFAAGDAAGLRQRLRHAGAGRAAGGRGESGHRRRADANPLTPKPPMFPARAKRVIFLFMSGGPSHVDTFDPKPRLTAEMGKPLPFAKPSLERTKTGNLLGSPFAFKKYGQAGIEVSELFPHVGGCMDDICVIRSHVSRTTSTTTAPACR